MTRQFAPFVLLGLDALLLLGGVWLLTHAFKTWRIERHHKNKPIVGGSREREQIREIKDREPLSERFPRIAKSA
jgi:hypothetical protein